MSVDERFETAVAGMLAHKALLTEKLDSESLLDLYALHSQGSSGDITAPKPDASDVKETAKWTAWNSKRGMSQQAAKEAYLVLADKLGARLRA